MSDESIQILINQHAWLVIASLALAITICVCFVALQYRKMRQTELALVLQAAILAKGRHITEMEREIISKPVPKLNLLKLFQPLLNALKVLLSSLFLIGLELLKLFFSLLNVLKTVFLFPFRIWLGLWRLLESRLNALEAKPIFRSRTGIKLLDSEPTFRIRTGIKLLDADLRQYAIKLYMFSMLFLLVELSLVEFLILPDILKVNRHRPNAELNSQRSVQRMPPALSSVVVNKVPQRSSTTDEIQTPLSTPDVAAFHTSTKNGVKCLAPTGDIPAHMKAILSGPSRQFNRDWDRLDADDHAIPHFIQEGYQ
jgi:hypothetical protein